MFVALSRLATGLALRQPGFGSAPQRQLSTHATRTLLDARPTRNLVELARCSKVANGAFVGVANGKGKQYSTRGTKRQRQTKRKQQKQQASVKEHTRKPWQLLQTQPGKYSALHNELLDFAWRCSPTADEVQLAALTARAVEQAWQRHAQLYHGSKSSERTAVAQPFGSQAAGLALPGADLDLELRAVRNCPPLLLGTSTVRAWCAINVVHRAGLSQLEVVRM